MTPVHSVLRDSEDFFLIFRVLGKIHLLYLVDSQLQKRSGLYSLFNNMF